MRPVTGRSKAVTSSVAGAKAPFKKGYRSIVVLVAAAWAGPVPGLPPPGSLPCRAVNPPTAASAVPRSMVRRV
jgi:hypothetical protein